MTKETELEVIEKRHQKEIAHIYDLLRDICTFKKVRFGVNSEWLQTPDGYYRLQVPCTDFVPLAAFESIEAAPDKRANCISDVNSQFVTITNVAPFNGYIVAANIGYDDDRQMVQSASNIIIERELKPFSYNPVASKAIVDALRDIMIKLDMKTTIPESMPASDVYAWAKQPKKPCYTWDEICCTPDVITSVVYGDYEFCDCKGTVDLSALSELLDVPERMSQLICDIGISQLVDDIDLECTLHCMQHQIQDLDEELDSVKEKNDKDIEELKEAQAQLADEVDALNEKNAIQDDIIKANYESLKLLIKTEHEKCANACADKIDKLAKEVASNKEASEFEDRQIRSIVSALASECRLKHDAYNRAIEDITSEIVKLKASNTETTVGFLKEQVAQNQKDINKLKDKVEEISVEHTSVTASEKNGYVKVNGKNVLVYDDEKLTDAIADTNKAVEEAQKATEDVQKAVEEAQKAAEEAQKAAEDAQKEAEKANEAIENLADSEAVKELEKRIDEIEKSEKVPDGVTVEESEKNGFVTVKTPKKDENGNVVKDEDGNIQYESKDVKVYEFEITEEVDERLVTEKELASALEVIKNSGVAYANITYKDNGTDQIVSINDSQGLVWINGTNITVNMDEIKEILQSQETIIKEHVQDIAELKQQLADEKELNQQQADAIVALTGEIDKLKNAIAEPVDLSGIIARLSALEAKTSNLQNLIGDDNGILDEGEEPLLTSINDMDRKFKTFVDEDGELSENERPLWEKLNEDAALTEDDITDAFKNA